MSLSESNQEVLRRVLIASANPLFARGLQKLVAQRWANRRVEVRMASSIQEATATLESWLPDLVIVDYDDRNIPRAEFLSHFIAGERPMQVMLVSLRESGEVIVYDRRTLTPAQAENWLDLPWEPVSNQVQTVTDLPTSPRSGGMKHYVIAGVATVILTLILGLFLTNVGLMPVEAAAQAVPVDSMINIQSWLIAFLFSLISVFIVYSIIVFRRKPGSSGAVAHFKSSNSLEVFWTLVPLATVITLAFIGAQDLAQIKKADPNALEVKVTAFQWGWIFEYPDSGIQSNTLYMPVNKQVHFSLTSRDVIHSFWVPEFRIKQDVLPGANLVKEVRITANRLGDYKVRCAEMCGGAHAYMESPVKVVSQQDFDAWVAEQTNTANQSPADRGARLSKAQGCLACHSIDGAKSVGPTWKGLAGEQVKLTDGSTVTADDAYLHTAIIDPNAQVVAGFPPGLMPQTYKSTLTDAQIKDIIEYIKTLK